MLVAEQRRLLVFGVAYEHELWYCCGCRTTGHIRLPIGTSTVVDTACGASIGVSCLCRGVWVGMSVVLAIHSVV